MAIRGFKEIIEKKGYKVDPKDRAIFEREVGKAYFGMGISDLIEFIIYDSNDNQLPQGETGMLVRYIPLDGDNIRKYFLLTNNPSNRRMNGADEYIVDIEKLIVEAGYSNGIFKTQINLLNRRVGSEVVGKDKLWIHEIAPSRTEIRVLPLEDENETVIEDLQERINIILKKGQFRDDTIYFVKPMIESLKVEDILRTFLTINGTVTSGENYIKLIQKEFKITDFDLFINQIKENLIKATQYYIENKNWDISSSDYGKPLSTPIPIELSVDTIKQTISSILIKIIDKYLPKRAIQEENILTKDEQETLDKTKEILKTITSGAQFQSNVLENKQAIVRGCMDKDALNYNPLAIESDGSCVYPTPPPIVVPPPTPAPKREIVIQPAPVEILPVVPEIKFDLGGYPYYDYSGVNLNIGLNAMGLDNLSNLNLSNMTPIQITIPEVTPTTISSTSSYTGGRGGGSGGNYRV
jgi:hypothetical protein